MKVMERFVQEELGFKVVSIGNDRWQLQRIKDGAVKHVRPASFEEWKMYRLLGLPQSKWGEK